MMNGRRWWKIFGRIGVDGHGSPGSWGSRGQIPVPLELSIIW